MKKQMDRQERGKMILAMEQVMRSINDEEIFESWLVTGVADGDIDENTSPTDEVLDYYCEDENFADLMGLFCRIMRRGFHKDENGELYCDGICSKEKRED